MKQRAKKRKVVHQMRVAVNKIMGGTMLEAVYYVGGGVLCRGWTTMFWVDYSVIKRNPLMIILPPLHSASNFPALCPDSTPPHLCHMASFTYTTPT